MSFCASLLHQALLVCFRFVCRQQVNRLSSDLNRQYDRGCKDFIGVFLFVFLYWLRTLQGKTDNEAGEISTEVCLLSLRSLNGDRTAVEVAF